MICALLEGFASYPWTPIIIRFILPMDADHRPIHHWAMLMRPAFLEGPPGSAIPLNRFPVTHHGIEWIDDHRGRMSLGSPLSIGAPVDRDVSGPCMAVDYAWLLIKSPSWVLGISHPLKPLPGGTPRRCPVGRCSSWLARWRVHGTPIGSRLVCDSGGAAHQGGS